MKEAAWLVSERTEEIVARREAYVLCPEFFRRAKVQTSLVAGGAGLLGLAAWACARSYGDASTVLIAVAALSLGAIPLAHFWELRQAARREPDLALREGFGNGPGQFVKLIVRQGEAPTGEDRGMLWVEDGRLYFSGHRTSFGLVPSQVEGIASRTAAYPGIRYELEIQLAHPTAVGPLSISIGSERPPPYGLAELRDAKARIDRWHDRRGLNVEGQWPPLELGPGIVSERRLLFEAFAATYALPCLLVGLGVGGASWVAILCGLVIGLAVAFGEGSRVRWGAWSGRRRLRRRG